MKNKDPYYVKPYPIPLKYREQVKREINRMLELGIIRRSNSPYINPLAILKKKDGSIRICIDARKLNNQLCDDFEAPPSVFEILQQCAGNKFMSKFDFTSSYWQISLSEESKKYTAFKCDNHIYEFNVVPFGIKTSSAALIRGLHDAINDLDFLITFVDDQIVKSISFEQHICDLERLFQRLLKHNLRYNFKKSDFLCEEIEFLGYFISHDGIRPDPKKIKTIKHFPVPRNVQELQSFLGFVNFYTTFIENYSFYIKPLIELLKKDKKYEWIESQQEAFEKIKSLFDDSMILTYADPKRPYILTTDASDFAISAVLSQMDDNNTEKIVCFVSRTLKGSECNYFTTEKEMLALVWGLHKLEIYLRGAEIIVRTDHEALTFLKTCKFNNARLRRWNLAIQDFNIKPEYLPGRKNGVADYLSRLNNSITVVNTDDKCIIIASLLVKNPSRDFIKICKNLKQSQLDDDFSFSIINKLNNNVENAKRKFEIQNSN